MWKTGLGAVALACVLALPVAGQHAAHETHAAPGGGEFARQMHEAMQKMDADMMAPAPSGDPDRDFLAMMIPHHAGAVEMARLVLIHGKDPLVRQLAEDIIASQQAEIAGMQARLKVLERGPDPNPGGFPAVSGTRGP